MLTAVAAALDPTEVGRFPSMRCLRHCSIVCGASTSHVPPGLSGALPLATGLAASAPLPVIDPAIVPLPPVQQLAGTSTVIKRKETKRDSAS